MPDQDPELRAMLRKFLEKQDSNHLENKERGEAIKHASSETLEDIREIKRTLSDAFPDGDSTAHRMYHEKVMRTLDARERFWEDMRASLAKWGLIGAAGFACTALWIYFKAKVVQ